MMSGMSAIAWPNDHIREMVTSDPTAKRLGAQLVALGQGSATVEMVVTDEMCNGHGTCHGGTIFTLADIAMSYASNTPGVLAVASAADIQYVAPASAGQRLVAEGTTRLRYGRGERTALHDIPVRVKDSGELIAIFTGRTVQVSS